MPSSIESDLEDVFMFLSMAQDLEETNRIEAATKYYEAVYLMRRYADRIPTDSLDASNGKIRRLLVDKAAHYEHVARALMVTTPDDASVMADAISALTYSPRSPLSMVGNNRSASSRAFFPEEPFQPAKPQRNRSDRSVLSTNNEIVSATSEANSKLASALDLDEKGQASAAVQVYLEAAELFLQTIQMCKLHKEAQPVEEALRRRVGQTLDRVEELKNPPLSREVQTTTTTTRQPQRHALTAEEIQVLKQSSLIASGLFLPWSDQDAAKLAAECSRPQSSQFTDPAGFLPLSTKQKDRFHRWARPSDILRFRQQNAVLSSIVKPTLGKPCIVKAITPYSIQQKYVTDCSFIASLCICATFERRFRKRLITSILHPQDANGNPIYNPAGKYMVKLWLNGVARCVVVDDYLPVDKHGNLLCSQTTNSSSDSLELWVSLIEKAYMKLCGGYNFPGSNSGVDLFSLTGWIPERVHFAKDPTNVQDHESPPERAWERIFGASSYGDCLITVSTQRELSQAEADEIGLVTGHAYAVLGVLQTKNGTRLLQLKNPWAHKGWKGRFSSGDAESWRSPSFRKEVGYDPELASQKDDGVFFICWDDILKYFQNFHLSWNPDLFSSRLTVHGCWPNAQGPQDDTFNVGENPQYTLILSNKAIAKKATIWILISRHVTKQEQAGNEATDYLTVHIHRSTAKRERIWYPGRSGNCVLTGCYTNNPHVLVRYDVQDESDKHLTMILSQYQKSNDLNYTLSCFCTEDFHLGKPERDLLHEQELSGTWSTYTAGGPVGQDGFFRNPQYSVQIAGPVTLQLRISTTTTIASNIMLVPVRASGETADRATSEPVIDTGKYRHGFVVSDKKSVKAGYYTLIVSNFHRDQTGLFTLKVMSSSPRQVKISKIER